MNKVKIYYNELPHPGVDKFAADLHPKIHYDQPRQITITKAEFKKYWVLLPKTELISDKNIKDKIFYKYNRYSQNPYSDENDPGQSILKGLDVRHTTMMIGDVMKVNNIHYIVTIDGFARLNIK